MRADLEILETALGHKFSNRELLLRALTHKSLASEQAAGSCPSASDNEQFEFLGDAVLGFLVSEHVVQLRPDLREGRLSKLKAHLVSAAHLYEVALKVRLGEFLLLGRGEELSGGREKRALLANGVEALIAALYLDGGIEAARQFVQAHVIAGVGETTPLMDDPKTVLQELAQALKLPQPRYVVLRERGPEHAKTFTVEVRVGQDVRVQADSYSKKSAGQKAAQLALDLIRGQATQSPI